MLDRLFLSRLNSSGKIGYWVGQLIIIGLIAIIMFVFMKIDFDEGYIVFILGAIASVLVWGGICLVIWPVNKETKENKPAEPENKE